MEKQFGMHTVRASVTVNHHHYSSDADDWREHTVTLAIDLDKLLSRLARKACRSKAGKSTGLHGAVVCKRLK